MPSVHGHKHSDSVNQNRKAQLANAYNELGRELSSTKIRVVGNYTLGKVIGEGAYGKVRLGTHRLTSTRVAIKQIPKAMSASLTREIHHHRQLHHPHITQMYEVIATESSIWIVTELCCGGELFDYLVEKGRLSEDEGKVIFGQLCLAVAYLHDNGIVHRDLKLENVLLDERCRVKLGDFGFTREYERGNFMETFCGTTAYASPEMLQEVDVWSLGVILYCLLTGTLPFDDDDDEEIMRQKIIQGNFEDPVWLSLESRDLIKNVLQKDVTKRYTIPQIFAHPWFTAKELTYEPESPIAIDSHLLQIPRSSTPDNDETHGENPDSQSNAPDSSTASMQDHESPFAKNSDIGSSTPTTPDDSISDPFDSTVNTGAKPTLSIHRNLSNSTIGKRSNSDIESLSSRLAKTGERQPETVVEEDYDDGKSATIRPISWSNSSGLKVPPSKIRTPARTKRRSVSSLLSLSEAALGEVDKTPTPLPAPTSRDLDFAMLLSTPTPIIFSTPLERELLNNLSILGMDTAQIVHSVLTDACDSAGALWWTLKKKAEKRTLEEATGAAGLVASPVDIDNPSRNGSKERSSSGSPHSAKKKRLKTDTAVQTDNAAHPQHLNLTQSAPQLAFVPPTPTFVRPSTPPRPTSPSRSPMLSPSSSTMTGELSSRSHPSTPGSSVKDKDGSKGRKNRSGSVSIMQRATTALEAAGLVRKKSTEAVREEREKERERSRELERRNASGEESRSSHSHEPRSSHSHNGHSKLTKSPPLKAQKDYAIPSTPPPGEHASTQIGSPWVLADPRDLSSHHAGPSVAAVVARGEMLHSHSAPNLEDTPPTSKPPIPLRNRANILTSLRLWFNEDRKGKRKESDAGARQPMASSSQGTYSRATAAPGNGKRRGSNASTKYASRNNTGHRAKRPSMSSRRSSSVNSHRSSAASMQVPVLDSPQQMTNLRTMGSHTPNSERGDHSSRPSSIHSFSMQPKHRKSPSASSSGSLHLRTASPMQKYHRRGGSGSSTRVVRQSLARAPHARSNSATSSLYSPPSSRPTSFYEPSENEAPRTASPYRTRKRSDDSSSRRGGNSSSSTFVQKRQGPFMSPAFGGSGTLGKSSWKKSWGVEPPGWQTRTTQLPVEVLVIGPSNEPATIRDVFSGRHSISQAGDDSDWVDEDDDIPAFAGGLGQMGTSISSSSSSAMNSHPEPIVTLSPAPRGYRNTKQRNNNNCKPISSSSSSSSTGTGAGTMLGRPKSGHSPAGRHSPLPSDNVVTDSRSGRRQLPNGRSGPAFKHAIQEEDEDEEEE